MPQDINDVAKLVEGIQTNLHEMRQTHEAAIAKKADKSDVDVLDREKIERLNSAIDAANERIDAITAANSRKSARVTVENGNEVDLEAKAAEFANVIVAEGGSRVASIFNSAEFNAEALNGYKSAFSQILRMGKVENLNEMQRKALSVNVDPNGGYLVPPDMSGQIVRQTYEYTDMRRLASVQTISGPSLSGLYDYGNFGSGWVGETQSRPATDTGTIGTWDIPVHDLYANPSATQKFIDDSAVDVQSWVAMHVGIKFARDEGEAFVSGDGVAKPRGFLTYPNSTELSVGIEQFSTGVNGDFAAAPNGADMLFKMQYALKNDFVPNARWFMKRQTAGLLRVVKNTDGAYLWAESNIAGNPSEFSGHSVEFISEMPAIAAGSLSIAFGDMRQAYQIVDRMGIRVLVDPFTNKPNVSYYTTKRVGGAMVNGHALKLLKFAA